MMKRFILIPLIVLFTVGSLLAIALPMTSSPSARAEPALQHESEQVVVRAYFDDPDLAHQLGSWTEPWEVDYEKGFLVVDVTADGYQRLQEMGFRVEVDEALTEQLNQPRTMAPGQVSGIPGSACYRTVEETFDTAVALSTDYPHLATWIDAGDSWRKTNGLGGYDMMVLRLTNEAVPGPKPKIFIMSSMHAREYTPAELNTRLAEYLVANYGVDADVTWLLDYHEFHLMLQANPDGRKKAETGLYWRKNTNQNYCGADSNNRGADLNRNYSFYWDGCSSSLGCSSSYQCYSTYRGPSPASEPETQAVQNYVRAIFPDQRSDPIDATVPVTATGVFMDLHSYSELVLWPWGFTYDPAPNDVALQTLGRKLAYFNGYAPSSASGLYPTDGTTDDFAYGELGLAAYTYELGTSFFQDCNTFEDEILPDNLPSLIYLGKTARAPYLLPSGPDPLQVTAVPNVIEPGDPVTLTATLNDARFNNENGSEPTQPITAAAYYLDTPPWITETTPVSTPMTVVDGAFDSAVEDVQAAIDTNGLAPGRHTLYVHGQDAAGNWGVVSAIFLHVGGNVTPFADFVSSTPDALGERTVFTNTSAGGDLNVWWDFGDGTPGLTTTNAVHTYTETGAYTVTLTVSNAVGIDERQKQVQIMAQPDASFAVSSPVYTGETAVFTNTSTGSALSFRWDMGDGSPIASSIHYTHVYTAAGTYTVTLTAVNPVGEDVAVRTVTILSQPGRDHQLYLPLVARRE